MDIVDYHENRKNVDFNYINAVFDKQEREILARAQEKYPHSIIRMCNADLIAQGFINGIGGSVPAKWDGSIVQL